MVFVMDWIHPILNPGRHIGRLCRILLQTVEYLTLDTGPSKILNTFEQNEYL